MKYSYQRVSTVDKQSLLRQEKFARDNNVPRENWFQEKASGAKDNRVELNKLLRLLKENDELYVIDAARLTRSMKFLIFLLDFAKENKIKLVIGNFILDCTGQLSVLTQGQILMLGLLNEMQRLMIVESVKEGLAAAREKNGGINPGGCPRITKETLEAYIRSFRKLKNIMVILDFSESNLKVAKNYKRSDKNQVKSKLLEICNTVNISEATTANIKYSLGAVGEYFLATKQYGQLLPKEIYSLRFNQIDMFNMAIYITRMIVINKRWSKDIKIYVSTLLTRTMKYNKKGYNILLNHLQYLERIDAAKRAKKIKQIEKQLNDILLMFKEKEIITDYKFHGKFQYKTIRDNELYVVILMGKKDKGK